MLFLLGMGSRRARWEPITDHLVDHLRCVSVDLPGHGDSPDDGCGSLSAAAALASRGVV